MFIVEDGSVVAGANSYASVENADSYAFDRGLASWLDLTEATKEQKLVSATDYLDRVYLWGGTPVEETQPLVWPRTGYTDALPTTIKRACIELAIKGVDTPLFVAAQEQGAIKRTKTQAGPVLTEVEYVGSGLSSTNTPRFDDIDALVRPYLSAVKVSVSVVDVVRV